MSLSVRQPNRKPDECQEERFQKYHRRNQADLRNEVDTDWIQFDEPVVEYSDKRAECVKDVQGKENYEEPDQRNFMLLI